VKNFNLNQITPEMTKKIQELSIIEQNILSNIQSGNGLQNALAPLVKRVMEAALQ
jgi:hypothetical protein